MIYHKDLPLLQSSIEMLRKSVFQKASNDENILVVGLASDDTGQRTAGIQLGKELAHYWEVKGVDIQLMPEINNFAIDRLGRSGNKILTDDKTGTKFQFQFKHVNLTVRAAYHSQSVSDVLSMTNKWLYWQDKLSYTLKLMDGLFEIRVTPEETIPIPSKNLDSSENSKLEVSFTVSTYAGIINKAFLIKTINFNTKLTKEEEVLDLETIVIDDTFKPQLIED